jgi:peptidoglycan/LPS O-acetylase OafA/YrhL
VPSKSAAADAAGKKIAIWAGPGIAPNNFDFLRFTFALAVILSHSYALLRGGEAEPLMRSTRGQISLGALAVDSFFIISGFLVTHSWLHSASTSSYFKKRILRIYPAFVVATLAVVAIVFPLASKSGLRIYAAVRPMSVLGSMVQLRGYEPPGLFPANLSHAANGSLWSISYEFWCYAGIALFGLCGVLKRRWLLAAIFCAAISISLVFLGWKLTPGGKFFGVVLGFPAFWARLLPYYLAGTLFYLYRNSIPRSAGIASAAAGSIALGAVIPFGLAVVLPISWTYLIFWFAFHPTVQLHGWARFGDFSYGLYLYAFPIQQLLIMWSGVRLSPITLFASAVPFTILAAIVSWHVVEKRFLRMKPIGVEGSGRLMSHLPQPMTLTRQTPGFPSLESRTLS